MYISDNNSPGRGPRRNARFVTLRPSQAYHYANPDARATSIYRSALAGLGQTSAIELAKKLKHLSFFPHFVEVNGKDVALTPADMDPKIYDGPENYKIAALQELLKPVMVMQNKKFRHIKVALVDLTKNVLQPEFAGSFDHKQQVTVASIAKLGPMLGAFQLRQDVWFLRGKTGAKTIADLFDLVRQGLADSQLDPGGKATPFTRGISLRGKLVLVNGNPFRFGKFTVPQLDDVFATDPPGSTTRIKFKSTGESVTDLRRIVDGFNGHLVENAQKELNEALRVRDKARIESAKTLLADAKREFPEFRKKLEALGFWERMIISVGGDVPASNFATHTVVRDVGFPYIASTLFQTGIYDTNRGGGLWIGTDVAGGHWSGAPGGGSMLSGTAGSIAALMTLLAQRRMISPIATIGMTNLMQKLPRTGNPGTGSWFQIGLLTLANRGSLKTVLAKVGLSDHSHEVALIEREVDIGGGKKTLLRYVAVGLQANNGTELEQLILELDKCILANNGLSAKQGGHP